MGLISRVSSRTYRLKNSIQKTMSYGRGNQNLEYKVYVGNLGDRPPRREQLEDEFSYYGPLRNVWVARSPPGFAYIEFESKRDAQDAARGLDGKNIAGRRIKVEMAKGSMKLRRGEDDKDKDSHRRSRSRTRSRSRSRSRSPIKGRGRDSRSRSRSY